jgi:hypothetical protein
MFGIIEEIKRSICKLSEGQVKLEKKVGDAVIEIKQSKIKEEVTEKKTHSSQGKGKGKKRKESSDDDEKLNLKSFLKIAF